MEGSVKEVETIIKSKEFQDNPGSKILNFHNYGLQSSENKETSSNENNTDVAKSVIFKFGNLYMCTGCQHTFSYLKNLKRHVQLKHPPLLPVLFPKIRSFHNYIQIQKNPQTSENSEQSIDQNNAHAFDSVSKSVDSSYVCQECQKTYHYVYNYKRHVQAKHPSLYPTISHLQHSYTCNTCNKNFKNSNALQYHKNTHHNLPNSIIQHKCPLCPSMFCRIEFNDHFEKSHNLVMKHVKLNFVSLEEFHEWKKSIERVTKSYFVKLNSKSTHKDGSMRQAYVCHRSGTFKSEAVMNKRKLKAQGSRKINAFCPAIMRITVTKEGTCQLTFQNQHVGHDNELHHLNLTLDEKKYVANKLASNLNLPISRILNDIRNSAAKDGAERLCLLNKKDLYNIRARFVKNNEFYLSTPKLNEKLTDDLKAIHNKHAESEQVLADISEIEKGWVLTLTDSNEVYLIKEISKSCNCTLVCIYCKVCINAYSCTCSDSSIEGNMCKHIHFFCTEQNKICDDHNERLDINGDVTESFSNSAPCSYPQKSDIVLKPSESSEKDKDHVVLINSEKRNALKKEFSDIVDSITTEEEYKLSENAIQDLAVKLKSMIQNLTKDKDDAVTPTTSCPVETETSESTQDHQHSNSLIKKIKKTKRNSNSLKNRIKIDKKNSNCLEPTSRTLILQMHNAGPEGAKICCINFAKPDKK